MRYSHDRRLRCRGEVKACSAELLRIQPQRMLLRRILPDGQRARLGLGSKLVQKPGLITQLSHRLSRRTYGYTRNRCRPVSAKYESSKSRRRSFDYEVPHPNRDLAYLPKAAAFQKSPVLTKPALPSAQ